LHSAFLYSEKFAAPRAYQGYPWLFERSEATYQLSKRLGLFDHEWMSVCEPKPASFEELTAFHTEEYLAVLKKANKGNFKEEWLHYGIGTTECPVYAGVYDYHALAVGSTLLGADLLERGEADIVFGPTGGFHHAGQGFAAGFCYLNDVVLAIIKWLPRKKRILFTDIDAHHGDQVQRAFYGHSRVMCISFHESGNTLFPFDTGFENEIGKGHGKGYTINVPLAENTSDEEFQWAFETVFLPVAEKYQPDIVLAAIGVDALFSDPFSHLQLTNRSISKAVKMIMQVSPRLLALGCGGYVLDNLARTWTLAWATMNQLEPKEEDAALFGGTFWGDNLASLEDQPHFVPDHMRKKARGHLAGVIEHIRRDVFPILQIDT
jgi:acetoin utilization protein AcuC